jgi:hypothetical protein
MTRYRRCLGLVAALVVVAFSAGTAAAQTSDLVGMLTSQLGVSEDQAAGGAGSLFDFAKGQMAPSDFDTVTSALPEVSDLMGAAPQGGSGGLLGSASSLLGGSSGGLEDAAGVASSFSDLGMSPDMMNEFVPVILDYAESAGSDQAMQLLQSAFSAL